MTLFDLCSYEYFENHTYTLIKSGYKLYLQDLRPVQRIGISRVICLLSNVPHWLDCKKFVFTTDERCSDKGEGGGKDTNNEFICQPCCLFCPLGRNLVMSGAEIFWLKSTTPPTPHPIKLNLPLDTKIVYMPLSKIVLT